MLMHNNRCYHQEIMHVQRMVAINNRPQATARISAEITDPTKLGVLAVTNAYHC
jgi:hypothetical protein